MGANELKGTELIQEVVALAEGLGDTQSSSRVAQGELHQELNDLLEANGQDAKSLTIDQLRQSLLLYLESIDERMSAECEESELESWPDGIDQSSPTYIS